MDFNLGAKIHKQTCFSYKYTLLRNRKDELFRIRNLKFILCNFTSDWKK